MSIHLLMRRYVVVHHSCEYNLHEEVNRGAMALTGNPVSMPSETYQTRRIFFWITEGPQFLSFFSISGLNFRQLLKKKYFLQSILDVNVLFSPFIGWPLTYLCIQVSTGSPPIVRGQIFNFPRGSPVMATPCIGRQPASSGKQLAGGATVGPIRFIMFCDCSI